MNFEEMIEARNAQKTTKVRMPYGFFYKRQIEGKYSNFVEFHDELVDNIFFTNSVKHECEFLAGFKHKAQLHFTPNEGDDGIYAIAIEVGNYLTLGQLLNDDPSVVARNDFLKKLLKEILDITVSLNDENVYHVCFAPSNILVRKTDNAVRLLCHGSFYSKVDIDDSDPEDIKFWGNFWVNNYNQVGDTLKCISGGNHPGLMHIRKTEKGFEVTAFDQVADGAANQTSAKKIFGDKYEAFQKYSSDDGWREQCIIDQLEDYATEHNLTATMYQDFGWPAKRFKLLEE